MDIFHAALVGSQLVKQGPKHLLAEKEKRKLKAAEDEVLRRRRWQNKQARHSLGCSHGSEAGQGALVTDILTPMHSIT